jgi:tetratricopeptide (TPR) repeat protein
VEADASDQVGLQRAEQAHAGIAALEASLGNLELAIGDYERAIEFAIDPRSQARYYGEIAAIYAWLDDEDSARAAIEAGLALLAEDDPLRAELEALLPAEGS